MDCYIYIHRTRKPRRRIVHHRTNGRHRFNIYSSTHKWEQPVFFPLLLYAEALGSMFVCLGGFCLIHFFLFSCFQMQIRFPSALFILCTFRPFSPQFSSIFLPMFFFCRAIHTIICHLVKTIFLSCISIMAFFVFYHGMNSLCQFVPFFFLHSFVIQLFMLHVFTLHTWFPYTDLNQRKWTHYFFPHFKHSTRQCRLWNYNVFIFATFFIWFVIYDLFIFPTRIIDWQWHVILWNCIKYWRIKIHTK